MEQSLNKILYFIINNRLLFKKVIDLDISVLPTEYSNLILFIDSLYKNNDKLTYNFVKTEYENKYNDVFIIKEYTDVNFDKEYQTILQSIKTIKLQAGIKDLFGKSVLNEQDLQKVIRDSSDTGDFLYIEEAYDQTKASLTFRHTEKCEYTIKTHTLLSDFYAEGEKGMFSVIAARPGVGKTTLVISFVKNWLENKDPYKVYLFSLEMPKEQMIYKLVSSLTTIPYHNIKNSAELSNSDFNLVMETIENIKATKNLYIDDDANVNIYTIENRLQKYIDLYGNLDVVIIDYLQLVKGTGNIKEREQVVAEISRQCKLMSKKYGCQFICLAQLNRDIEKRKDTRPVLSDLRESGAIEQDADHVFFINRNTDPKEDKTKNKYAEIIIGKNRHGETGSFVMETDLKCSYFKTISMDAYVNEVEKKMEEIAKV